jgi:pyruvate-formate lyase-activating enzyme
MEGDEERTSARQWLVVVASTVKCGADWLHEKVVEAEGETVEVDRSRVERLVQDLRTLASNMEEIAHVEEVTPAAPEDDRDAETERIMAKFARLTPEKQAEVTAYVDGMLEGRASLATDLRDLALTLRATARMIEERAESAA